MRAASSTLTQNNTKSSKILGSGPIKDYARKVGGYSANLGDLEVAPRIDKCLLCLH